MMTDKQLKALMLWCQCASEPNKVKMYAAFGFKPGRDGWPTVPTHSQTLPPANPVIRARDYDEVQDIATWGMTPEGTGPSDPTATPEQHKEEIANADYDAKYEALQSLIGRVNEDDGCDSLLFSAADIRQHWLELKAIMEPGSLCKDQLAKVGKNNDAK